MAEKGRVNIIIDLVLKSYISITWLYAGPISIGSSIFSDKKIAQEFFPRSYDFYVFLMLIKVKEGYDPKEVIDKIRDKLGKNLVTGYTITEMVQRIRENL